MHYLGIILRIGSANERRRYNETSSLIGWAHTQNYSCTIVIYEPIKLHGNVSEYIPNIKHIFWNSITS